jgi:ribosomal protein S18 acetylase RimI-like enzyme
MADVNYSLSLDGINWEELKATLKADNFDNGRTPAQLKRSAENSAVNCFAFADGRIIGTVRALSDWVCNAYIIDVWTLSEFRNQGVARKMLELVAEKLPGQHIYLFTDDAVEFYRKIGFAEQGVGMYKMSGNWLENESKDAVLS